MTFIIIIIIVIVLYVLIWGGKKSQYNVNTDVKGHALNEDDALAKKIAMNCCDLEMKKELIKYIKQDGTIDRCLCVVKLAKYAAALISGEQYYISDLKQFNISDTDLYRQSVGIYEWIKGEPENGTTPEADILLKEMFVLVQIRKVIYCDVYGNKLSDIDRRAKTIAKYADGDISKKLFKYINEDGTMKQGYLNVLKG